MASVKKTKSSGAPAGKFQVKAKIRRPGVHSKNKASKSKNSKNYLKRSRGQG